MPGLTLLVGNHKAGEMALVKCLSCRYCTFEPYMRLPDRHFPDHMARIKCSEGIIGLPPESYRHLPAAYTFWVNASSLKRPNSRAREAILDCDTWTDKGGGAKCS